MIFADALRELAAAHPDRLDVEHWLESERGLPTGDDVREVAAGHASYDAFVCGPGPFMKGVVTALKDRYAFKAEMDDEARRAMFPQNERLKA